jgi:acetate kinase
MKILVLNAGSSSIKFQLYQTEDESVLAVGKVERIGMDTAIFTYQPIHQPELSWIGEILDHIAAFRLILDWIAHKEKGVISSWQEIDAVGHRVVHGGEFFRHSVVVTEHVKQEIKRLFEFAPLHNPAHLRGIEAVEANLSEVTQVAVFDTAFHHTMSPRAYMYPIPRSLYQRHKIRKYGFHGTSHQYVSQRAAEFIGKSLAELKIISCHVGNGASITAIQAGHSVDTSMGMTPLEGMMMGTRSGDIDPAIVPMVMAKEDLSIHEVSSMLNKHSGLQGVSGYSSDMREIMNAMEEGNPHAQLAFEMYEYRLRKYIGAYAAAMNGVDVLVFTAGIGENCALLRVRTCSQLTYLGIKLDLAANESQILGERRISMPDSTVEVLIIPTNEELVIARDTYELIRKPTLL